MPFNEKTNIDVVLEIERFSFYKESAEYLIAPFTKFKLKKTQIKNKYYKIYL